MYYLINGSMRIHPLYEKVGGLDCSKMVVIHKQEAENLLRIMCALRNWYTLGVKSLRPRLFEGLHLRVLRKGCRFESYYAHMKKTCTNCQIEKDSVDFARDKSRVDGRHTHCKVCRRLAARQRYSTQEIETVRVRNRARSERSAKLIALYKDRGCELCPEREPCCLDFHHRDPTQKDFGIGNYRNVSEERFKSELAKCAVLCSNCHRKVHAGLISLLR